MARLKRLSPTEDEHICNAAPSLTAQAAIRLAASTKRARHVAEATHPCLTRTSSSIAVIQGPGATSEVPVAASGLCRQDSPVGQQTPQQSGRQPGCVEHNQVQSCGGPSPTHSSADADSNGASGSSTSSTECSSSSGSGEECSSGDVGDCDEEQLCSSSHGGQNGGSNHEPTAAAPATPGTVRQELPRAGNSSIAATSSSHNSSRSTSSDGTSSASSSSGDTSSGDTSSDSCSSDDTSSDGSSSSSSASSSSDNTSSDNSSSDDTSSDGTSSDNTSSDGPSGDGTSSSGTDTSRATSSEPSSPSSRGNTNRCPANSADGSSGQKHSGPSSSDNTSSSSGSSGSGPDPTSDRSSSSDDTSSTSGSSDSSSHETTSSSDDCASSGSSSSSSSGAGSSANDGLAAQPSAAVDPDWAVSSYSEGGTDDSGFAQCSSTLGDELERLQGGRRPGAATAAESDAQGPGGAPHQAAVRQPPAAALAAAPPLDGCVRLLLLELCAGTCPVAEQARLSQLIPTGRPTYEVVAYAAVECEPGLAAAAPTAQSLGIQDKQHLVTCGDITDEQVQQGVLRFVRKALRRQVRAGQPIQAILVAAGPPCQPYSNAVAPPPTTAPGEQRKAFRQKRRLMQVQGDKVVQAVLGVWDGIRGLVASTAAAQHNHNSTQAPLPDAAAAAAAAGPSIVRTSAACSTSSNLPCYLVLESVASTASLALRNRPCMKQRLAGHQLLRSRHHWCSYGSAHHAKKPSDVFTNMKGMPAIVPCTHGHKRHAVTVRGTLGQVSRAIWPGEFASRCLLLAAEEARQQGAA